MNLQQLRAVREAIRCNFNLTQAAERLFTSQPGVSKQIRELEEELGVQIFVRHGKRFVGLTDPGRDIVPVIERLLEQADNLKAVAKRLDRDVEDLVVMVLDRDRHQQLIADIRAVGARIRLIGDGDLSAGISAAVVGTGVHMVMGTGGAPEGVLTAAALRCLNGQILARLVVSKPEHQERLAKMGVKDPKRIYNTADLAPGQKIIFACSGVTDGNLLKGVRFFGDGVRTSSMILTLDERQVRFIDSVHLEDRSDIKVRFN